MSLPRVAALVAFIAIAAGSFQTFYLRIYRMDIRALGAQFTEMPYRKLPGLRRLYVEAERRIPRGARVLIHTPHRRGEGGYAYAYARSHFMLPDRQIVPMREPRTEAPLRVNLAAIDYIACWRPCPAPRGFAVIWRSADGMLLERRR